MRWTSLACLMTILLVFAVLLSPAGLLAAPVTGGTGPGGIGTIGASTDLLLWVRGDAGVVFGTGTNVAAWTDQSGRGNTATQVTPANQPTQSISINTVPVLTFPGTAGSNLKITSFSGLDGISNGSMIGMYDSNDPTEADQVAFSTDNLAGAGAYPRVEKYTPDGTHRWLTGAQPNAWRYGAGSTVNQLPQVYVSTYDGTQALDANRQSIRIDGTSYVATPGGTTTAASNPTVGPVRIGSWVGDNVNFNGNIGEIAVYNRTLNTTEQQIGENYVSSKFNITINAATDHYVGDAPGAGNFDFDVFGIGNDGTSSVASAGSTGLGIENATITSGQWVLAGHASGPNGVTNADMLSDTQRWERSWFIDTTGVTTANIAFDWNDDNNSAAFSSAFNGLFFRSANSGLFTLISIGTVDIGNQRVDFLNVSLNPLDGYYTLGSIPTPEPSTLTLLGLGVVGMAVKARRRRRTAA